MKHLWAFGFIAGFLLMGAESPHLLSQLTLNLAGFVLFALSLLFLTVSPRPKFLRMPRFCDFLLAFFFLPLLLLFSLLCWALRVRLTNKFFIASR